VARNRNSFVFSHFVHVTVLVAHKVSGFGFPALEIPVPFPVNTLARCGRSCGWPATVLPAWLLDCSDTIQSRRCGSSCRCGSRVPVPTDRHGVVKATERAAACSCATGLPELSCAAGQGRAPATLPGARNGAVRCHRVPTGLGCRRSYREALRHFLPGRPATDLFLALPPSERQWLVRLELEEAAGTGAPQ
jgi:hypothetical protein